MMTNDEIISAWKTIIKALMNQSQDESQAILALAQVAMENHGLTNLALIGKTENLMLVFSMDDRGENGQKPQLLRNTLESLSLLIQFGAVCDRCGQIHETLVILDEKLQPQTILKPVDRSTAVMIERKDDGRLDPLQNAPTSATKQ